MEKIKVAVIGVGHLGAHHARIYSKLENTELAGVCDIIKKRAKKIARFFKTKFTTNYNDFLNNVDAVSISTPTNTHYKIAKDFLENGVNCLIEKPITITCEEAEELLKIANKNNLILQVGHIERFNSAVMAVEQKINEPKFIESHRLGPFKRRSSDIGVVLDLMIHDIDIVLALVKSKIKSMDAIGVNVLTNYEDIANARLVFENGCVCDLTASRITEKEQRKIRIFQKDSYISLDYAKQEAFFYKKKKNSIKKKKIRAKIQEPLFLELGAFINCVRQKEQPIVSAKEATDALRLALEITNKIKQNSKHNG